MVPIVIFAVLAIAGAAALVYFGRTELKRLSRIRETPTTHASDVSSGYVEVKGVVEATNVLNSPFQMVPAVFVRWSVEEYRRRGKSSSWVTVLSGVDSRDFWIRDESGRVRVPCGAVKPVLYLAGKNTTASGTFRAAPEHIERFLSEHGRSSTGWVFNKSMRYTEECIQPGEHIYAIGWTRREGNEPAFTQGPQSSDRGELILANLTEEELAHRIGSRGRWMVGGGSVLGLGAFTALVYVLLVVGH
jgi:hypothetical protein